MKLLALVQAKIAFGSFINDFTNSTSGPDLNFSMVHSLWYHTFVPRKFCGTKISFCFFLIPDFIFGLLFVSSTKWGRDFFLAKNENNFNSEKVVNVHMIQSRSTVRVARTKTRVHVFGHMKTDVATASGSVQK